MTPATPDPAVRSIQIASALIERLGELVKPRSVLALGGYAAVDDLELRLGEAQQTLPEVWRHLDDARTALVARGIEIDGYEIIRLQQDPAMLASSNIDVKRQLNWLGLAFDQLQVINSKTVVWDSRKIVSAIAACETLKRVTPGVDWAALDRADRAQIAAVGSLRTGRSTSIMLAIVAVAIVALAVNYAYVLVNRGDAGADKAAAAKANEKQQAEDREMEEAKHRARLATLTSQHTLRPCDAEVLTALVAQLDADGQVDAARQVEQQFKAECPQSAPSPSPR